MRLTPIENPPGLMPKIAYWMAKRQLGKVIMPMKVVNARMPKSFKLAWEMVKLAEGGLSLDKEIAFYIKSYVSILNKCYFCEDIAKAVAVQDGLSLDKYEALGVYATSPLFSERERAALAYVEEATTHKRVSDATFEALRPHFSEQEIVEITWLNALENYYNLINLPLGIEADGLCAIALDRTGRPQRATA